MRLTALLFTLLLLAIPAHATEAELEPASTIEAQTFVTERGWGTLIIDSDNYFTLNAMGANGHSCSLEGVLDRATTTASTSTEGLEPNEPPCRFALAASATGFDITVVEANSESCRMFCGARAMFEGSYHKISPACDPANLGRLTSDLMGAKAASTELEAKARTALTDCAVTLAPERKDLLTAAVARQRHLAGDNAACQAELAPLAELLAMSEQEISEGYPPTDAEMMLELQGKLRAVAALCP